MSTEYLMPSEVQGVIINETDSNQYMVLGGNFLDETFTPVSAGGTVLGRIGQQVALGISISIN